MSEKTVQVVCRPCPLCGVAETVTMPLGAYYEWQSGIPIQKAWSLGTVAERELLVTGYHNTCFDIHFPPEEE